MTSFSLLNDATSPFGRKVLVAAIERKIDFKEIFVDLSKEGVSVEFNPLRQIPTLIKHYGQSVFDSDAILLHLDELHGLPALVPFDRCVERAMRTALANGAMQATLSRVLELRRPPAHQDLALTGRLEHKIENALDAFATTLPAYGALDDYPTADQISVAVCLGYVDFRYATEWRRSRPHLADWFHGMSQRPSLLATVPTRSGPVRVENGNLKPWGVYGAES